MVQLPPVDESEREQIPWGGRALRRSWRTAAVQFRDSPVAVPIMRIARLRRVDS